MPASGTCGTFSGNRICDMPNEKVLVIGMLKEARLVIYPMVVWFARVRDFVCMMSGNESGLGIYRPHIV